MLFSHFSVLVRLIYEMLVQICILGAMITFLHFASLTNIKTALSNLHFSISIDNKQILMQKELKYY